MVEFVALRPVHVEPLRPMLGDPRVWRMLPAGKPNRPQPGRALAAELLEQQRGLRIPFVIFDDARPVGLCGLSQQGHPFFSADLYFWLEPGVWGRGLGTAAVVFAVQHARALGLRQLESFVLTENAASRRVLEKAGFVLQGVCGTGPQLFPHQPGLTAWHLARIIHEGPLLTVE